MRQKHSALYLSKPFHLCDYSYYSFWKKYIYIIFQDNIKGWLTLKTSGRTYRKELGVSSAKEIGSVYYIIVRPCEHNCT